MIFGVFQVILSPSRQAVGCFPARKVPNMGLLVAAFNLLGRLAQKYYLAEQVRTAQEFRSRGVALQKICVRRQPSASASVRRLGP